MPLKCLHLLRPQEKLLPGFDSWLLEVMGMLRELPKWDGCEIVRDVTYDERGFFDAQSVADKILVKLGPIVIVNNVQTPARLELNKRLGKRTVIVHRTIADSTSLWQALEEAHDQFTSGEPRLKRGLILCLLLMNKLEKEHMWGGKSKGYKWASDLPTGRGMPDGYEQVVPSLLGYMLSAGVLIRKTSQGKSKFALNPSRKPEIYDSLERRTMEHHFPTLHRFFEKETETLSVRLLDSLTVF